MNKKALSLLTALCLCALSAGALAATANASVVAPETQKVTAPFSGTLLPFDVTVGERVSAGEALFALDTTPVYAAQSGTVAAVFAAVGDDAAGVTAYYGALAVIEPEHPLYVAADTRDAYDKDENRYVHAGETVYLKCGDEKGTGLVTAVNGESYTVQILTGDYDLKDTVRCYRDSGYANDSDIGRGKATRYPDALVTAAGRIAAVCVKAGDAVKTGDLLFETVDAQSAKDAPRTLTAPSDGAVTALYAASGAQVYRGQLLCEIADLSALELSAEVDEVDLNGVRVGDTLSYTLDAFAGEAFSGTVTEIRPVGIQKQNATYFDVRVTLPANRDILPGMNGTVTLGGAQ